MKRFSYLIGGLDEKWGPEDEQTQLDKLGAMGWELVSVVMRNSNRGVPCCFHYFRREIFDDVRNSENKFNLSVDYPETLGNLLPK